MKTFVWFNTDKVGEINLDAEQRIRFCYDEHWIQKTKNLENSGAISQSMPTSKRKYESVAHNFFANLLPEGELRKSITNKLGISEENDAQLLFRIGGECAGALSVGPTVLHPDLGSYVELNSKNFLESLKQGNWIQNKQTLNRLSLAGAQGKLPVLYENGIFCLPENGAASNTIIKVNTLENRYPHLVENEYFCMQLAELVGLKIAKTQAKAMSGIPFLLSHRYDRFRSQDGWTMRLHQEDFCQVLGFPPLRKYEKEEGPSFQQLFNAARSFLVLTEINEMLKWALFNLCIGNCDAHGKNISVLYSESGKIQLAPFYDLVSTMVYPLVNHELAMSFGRAKNLAQINKESIAEFARAIGMKPLYVLNSLKGILRQIPSAMKKIELEMSEQGWSAVDSWPVAQFISENCSKLKEKLF
jgi:serine/threonine-protein kinase HipA